MIVEIGHFALVLALLVAVFQMVVPAWGAHVRDRELMATAEPAALCQLGLLMVAFLSLINAHVSSDFSVANVVANSHSTKPLIYRISGVWGNHEGSMVLWVGSPAFECRSSNGHSTTRPVTAVVSPRTLSGASASISVGQLKMLSKLCGEELQFFTYLRLGGVITFTLPLLWFCAFEFEDGEIQRLSTDVLGEVRTAGRMARPIIGARYVLARLVEPDADQLGHSRKVIVPERVHLTLS